MKNKVHCSSDLRWDGKIFVPDCSGPNHIEHCPVKHGMIYESLGEHILYTNYYCRFFPKKKATAEPTVIQLERKQHDNNKITTRQLTF